MAPKSSVVLVHGEWADGSSWSKVIPLLQKNGFHVTAVSSAADLAGRRRCRNSSHNRIARGFQGLGRVTPTEVGHHRSRDECTDVVGLVYVSAFAPDEGESLGDLYARSGTLGAASTSVRIMRAFCGSILRHLAEAFAQDVDPLQVQIMAVVQKPIAARIFSDKVTRPAWELKPSWYFLSEIDRMIPAETQRFMSKRMGAAVVSVPASHWSMVSHPDKVAKLISEAASAAG